MEVNLDVLLDGVFSCHSLQGDLNSIMWGISVGQYVVGVLWLNLLLQKICKDLEHWFPTILASYLSLLCVIWHAVALLSPYLLGLHCVSALAATTFSLIPTGFGITITEVTVLCPKMPSSWGSIFTGLKNRGFDLTSGWGHLDYSSWLDPCGPHFWWRDMPKWRPLGIHSSLKVSQWVQIPAWGYTLPTWLLLLHIKNPVGTKALYLLRFWEQRHLTNK